MMGFALASLLEPRGLANLGRARADQRRTQLPPRGRRAIASTRAAQASPTTARYAGFSESRTRYGSHVPSPTFDSAQAARTSNMVSAKRRGRSGCVDSGPSPFIRRGRGRPTQGGNSGARFAFVHLIAHWHGVALQDRPVLTDRVAPGAPCRVRGGGAPRGCRHARRPRAREIVQENTSSGDSLGNRSPGIRIGGKVISQLHGGRCLDKMRCRNDSEAIRKIGRLLDGKHVEIWTGARLVTVLRKGGWQENGS